MTGKPNPRCSEWLRANGQPYPRTCAVCRLGPCPHLPEVGAVMSEVCNEPPDAVFSPPKPADVAAPVRLDDGHYWFRSPSGGGTIFVARREEGNWYVPGLADSATLSPANLIGPAARAVPGNLPAELEEGYYWFRSATGEDDFVALLQDGVWYLPAVGYGVELRLSYLIGEVPRPPSRGLN